MDIGKEYIDSRKKNGIAAEYVDIDSLKLAPDNPRINEHVVEKVAKSIQSYGFAAPIVAQLDGTILAGHTRFKAAKSLNLLKVPCRYMDISGDKAKLYRIADNKLGELADWNLDMLGKELEELSENYKLELNDMGFSDDELLKYMDIDISEDQEENQETDFEALDNKEYEPGETFEAGKVIEVGTGKIICGCCIETMRKMPEASIDSIVCDPPYQINFMGSATGWDKEFDSDEWSRQCLRVLKPGGHLIAFAATRTIHKIMVSVEKAGFEIRDLLSWLYFSGFPKSMNISKQIDKMAGVERKVVGEYQVSRVFDGSDLVGGNVKAGSLNITKPATPDAIKWDGWGTGLKPAQEPAVLARKPMEKGLSITANVLKHGTGSLNIDKSRFGYGDPCWVGPNKDPGDVIFYNSSNWQPNSKAGTHSKGINVKHNSNKLGRWPANIYQCAKPSRSERDQGLEDFEPIKGHESVNRKEGSAGLENPRAGSGRTASEVKNYHPTVKPVKLMDWLVGLVTPLDGVVLDTFGGSGTTGLAANLAGYKWILIEKNPDYCSIIHGRIAGNDKEERG
jgi:DNA modification methylase